MDQPRFPRIILPGYNLFSFKGGSGNVLELPNTQWIKTTVMKVDLKVAHIPVDITHFYLNVKNQKLQEKINKKKYFFVCLFSSYRAVSNSFLYIT